MIIIICMPVHLCTVVFGCTVVAVLVFVLNFDDYISFNLLELDCLYLVDPFLFFLVKYPGFTSFALLLNILI